VEAKAKRDAKRVRRQEVLSKRQANHKELLERRAAAKQPTDAEPTPFDQLDSLGGHIDASKAVMDHEAELAIPAAEEEQHEEFTEAEKQAFAQQAQAQEELRREQELPEWEVAALQEDGSDLRAVMALQESAQKARAEAVALDKALKEAEAASAAEPEEWPTPAGPNAAKGLAEQKKQLAQRVTEAHQEWAQAKKEVEALRNAAAGSSPTGMRSAWAEANKAAQQRDRLKEVEERVRQRKAEIEQQKETVVKRVLEERTAKAEKFAHRLKELASGGSH
jgi:hypothetical protein